MKILYVEDDAGQRDRVSRALEGARQTVLTASNSRDGLTSALAFKPDVLLLDIQLGEVDGLVLAAQIEKEKRTRQPAFNPQMIAFSVSAARLRNRALVAGCIGVIDKLRIEPTKVLSEIELCLSKPPPVLSLDEWKTAAAENSSELADLLQKRIEMLDGTVTQLRQAQAGLIATERIAATGRMGLALAHELLNPLAAALGAIELLNSVSTTPKRKQYHDIAVHEVQRASRIINGLLSIHAPSSGERSTIDIVAIVQDVLLLLDKQISHANIVLEVPTELNDHMTVGIYALFYQVLFNLILNAIEAMPCGGTLTVAINYTTTTMLVQVMDTGGGIKAGSQLFEPLFTTKSDGHGLGLYVARLIAEAYDAHLYAENNATGGATFIFELPYLQP